MMSPNYICYLGFYIYVKVAERSLDEPPHVHVAKGRPSNGDATKYWVRENEVVLDGNASGLNKAELAEIKKYIYANRTDIIVWYLSIMGKL